MRAFPKRPFSPVVVSGYIPITQQSECFADTFLSLVSNRADSRGRFAGPGVRRETEVIDHLQERILQIDKHDVKPLVAIRFARPRDGPENVVPERARHSVAEPVVLEVMPHVVLAHPLAQLRLGHEMMDVVVRVVVDQVADQETGETDESGRRPEDEDEGGEDCLLYTSPSPRDS